MKLLLATKNEHKLQEIQKLLPSIQLLSLNHYPQIPDIQETESTFLGNALLKAKTIYQKLRIPVLADDSGLEVSGLNNGPGVFSKRYAGEKATDHDRIKKVIHGLRHVPSYQRQARFICAMVLYDKGNIFEVEGFCHGEIVMKPVGKNGFGYDPIFFMPDLRKTMAQLSMEEKNVISHRANALKKIKDILEHEYEL